MRSKCILLLSLFFALAVPVSAEETHAERVEEGQEAPAFTLESSAGESHSLSDLRGEKNLVVIFFRGTW